MVEKKLYVPNWEEERRVNRQSWMIVIVLALFILLSGPITERIADLIIP